MTDVVVATRLLKDRALALTQQIHYKDGYKIIVGQQGSSMPYLQVHHWRPDVHTGVEEWGHGGKGYLMEHMTDSAIVRMAFSLFLAYETHECREFFRYAGRSIFGPHMDIEDLWIAADPDKLDYK